MRFLLIFNTIRHLKVRQIVGRLIFHGYRPRPILISGASARSTTKCFQKPLSGTPSFDISHHPTPDTPRMSFLGDELVISQASDWNHDDKAKLFLYNVHYFDDLNASNAGQRKAIHNTLISRWINENPPPAGNGWEPYPLSLRIVNWIQFFSRQQSVPAHWIDSLATQTHYLAKKLEYHLLGNHLFTNAKALVFAGCYLNNADKLLAKGLQIIDRELGEQVLGDGGHFELSPMYHCIAIEDLMDLINLAQCYPQQIPHSMLVYWQQTLQSMFVWLDRMCHPDGQISLFNDSAFDIAPDHEALAHYASTLQITAPVAAKVAHKGLHHSQQSGYVSLHRSDISCIMDVGHIGPDYLPGHAHADCLTFELSVHGYRLICNSGTSEYGTGPERLRQRGTDAHNTVLVDQENSSEVWSGFRVARRARPVDVSVTSGSATVEICASHTGYRRLAGRNLHRRCWSFGTATSTGATTDESKDASTNILTKSLTITDTIAGRFSQAVALFHLHPSVQAATVQDCCMLTLPDNRKVSITIGGGTVDIEPSTWHPRFGESIATHRLVIQFLKNTVVTTFSWQVQQVDA